MQWTLKKTLVAVAAVVVLWGGATQAQETETSGTTRSPELALQKLRWKNGDILPGQLLESTSGTIRWASPYFSDDLVIDSRVLDAVIFPEQSVPPTEAFRVGTVTGDIWMADIVGSDEDTFLFSSKRHGRFRVNRTAIYTLERRVHPNLIFDGSHLTAWKLPDRHENNQLRPGADAVGSNWYPDRGGHPQTHQVKSRIFHALDWPQRFEIDLELAATSRSPGFVFALGRNLYDALRLETWVNELVVVQGTLFESVLTVQPDRRSFQLRLVYDAGPGVLRIFDVAGNMLLELKDVQPTVEEAGLYVFNRGQDLTIRRLRVYRQPTHPAKQRIDSSKPRIHKMDGQVIHGELFVEENSIYVLDTDRTRHDIDLQQIDRIVQPGTTLSTEKTEQPVDVTYPDGAVLRGKIVQVNRERVILQTRFTDEPVTCSLAGAALLRLESTTETEERAEGKDELFHPLGSLRGRVSFDGKGMACIQWQPVGAVKPVQLTDYRTARIERSSRRASKMWPFDWKQYPHVLHLKNGEIVPCQMSSYDGTTVNFQSPLISVQRIDAAHIKALEFSGRTHAPSSNSTMHATSDGPTVRIFKDRANAKVQKIEIKEVNMRDGPVLRGPVEDLVLKNEEIVTIIDDKKFKLNPENDWIELVIEDKRFKLNPKNNRFELVDGALGSERRQLDGKLERALTVPRFSRDNPPNHILVANTGDMKRGKLLGFNGQTIQFDSKLRQSSIPIERVARVVDVSKPEAPAANDILEGHIRVKLTDGSILVFEPLESTAGELLGRSPIYGAVTLPVNSIQQLRFGDAVTSFKAAFEQWVVRPAKEPTFGEKP